MNNFMHEYGNTIIWCQIIFNTLLSLYNLRVAYRNSQAFKVKMRLKGIRLDEEEAHLNIARMISNMKPLNLGGIVPPRSIPPSSGRGAAE